METVRESWTDERLDDMSRRMELGFAEIRNGRFRSLQRMMIQFQGILIVGLIGLIATQI